MQNINDLKEICRCEDWQQNSAEIPHSWSNIKHNDTSVNPSFTVISNS